MLRSLAVLAFIAAVLELGMVATGALVEELELTMDRAGMIHPSTGTSPRKLKHSSDPWE